MVKRVLMIAYHFPPAHGSSGVQRTLKFAQYLPDCGWEPIVLTVNPRAYERTDTGQLSEVRDNVVVRRAFALDTARHLAIRGTHSRLLALPDRWVSWWLGALPAGVAIVRKYRPSVIWSTYPIATAHLIGLTLRRLTGLPWVADFRDSMTEDEYPRDPMTRRMYRWVERRTVTQCSRAVFTAPGTVRMYSERCPHVPSSRWKLIANGYDEDNFQTAEHIVASRRTDRAQTVLLHSGLLYPSERDPGAFFAAIANLLQAGKVSPKQLKVVLRASGYVENYQDQLNRYGIQNIIFLEPALSYCDALAEMLSADGLLLFQASNCNHQIPAKLYEYLRSGRPILALTDPAGDTAHLLRETGVGTIAPLDSPEQIATSLLKLLDAVGAGTAPGHSMDIARYSRKRRTADLAEVLDALINGDGNVA